MNSICMSRPGYARALAASSGVRTGSVDYADHAACTRDAGSEDGRKW